MLIGICGAKCAGKSTVAQYLIDHHGFKKLHLEKSPPPPPPLQNGVGSDAFEFEPKAATSPPPPPPSPPPLDGRLINGSLPLHLKQPSSSPSAAAAARYTFPTVTALLDFVTQHWRARWVTTDIHDEGVLDALARRPFFILISVDAPVTVRWRRHQQRQGQVGSNSSSRETSAGPISLEDFVIESDRQLYSASGGALPVMSRASVRLVNTSGDLAHLYATLAKLDLTDADRLRPRWDSYFMSLASLAAHRSNCMKRAVGCVLVDARHHVVSTGYNGTPRHLRNCAEGGCPRCNAGHASGVALATCLCLHAEENALLEAGRERIRDGSVLYCNTCPCLTCSIKIVQVGISEVVYNQGYSMDGEAAQVFRTAGVRLRQFSPPANGLIHLEKMQLY
ncbi:cytidine deaminase-like protein [Xylariaceae sp. FL0662B]|nr:cytidine deaminase-like protein [Xylariaceae sp. FL0662B]